MSEPTRNLHITGIIAPHYVKRDDYGQARYNVVMTLHINPIQAELWLDRVTGCMLQYYVAEKGHPISEEGYRVIQQITGPHHYAIIKALNALL